MRERDRPNDLIVADCQSESVSMFYPKGPGHLKVEIDECGYEYAHHHRQHRWVVNDTSLASQLLAV